jgi:hypothetical protein
MWKRVEHARITKDKNLAQCKCCVDKRETKEKLTLVRWLIK